MCHLQAVQLLLQLRHTDLLLLDPVQDLLLRPGHLFLKRQADTVDSKSHKNHFGPNDEFDFLYSSLRIYFHSRMFFHHFKIAKNLFKIKFTTNNKFNN